MKKIKIIVLLILVVPIGLSCGKKTEKTDLPIGPARPVPFTQVNFTDDFWKPRLDTNLKVTIPFDFKKCEETGRINNFAVAGGLVAGKFKGLRYDDSDLYKVMEAASYALMVSPDPELEAYMDSLIGLFAAAQEEDGYLFTIRTADPDNMPDQAAGPKRWSQLKTSHELYNVGHMYEAAVAHYQATGKRNFLDIAIKNADLIDRIFGPGKVYDVPGHQEIELGLVKLYRATGDERYLRLSRFFLDQRGKREHREINDSLWKPEYAQDHIPVNQQHEAVGHAVRAGYMYAGMADVAALMGEESYITALDCLWANVTGRKMYITGGVGSTRHGEAFGDNYSLPSRSAYNETCAAVAQMLWNYRMFLMKKESKYFDVLERTLYNGFLSGVHLSGDKFNYPNPLEAKVRNNPDKETVRSPWFGTSCCPTNVARFLPSLPGYVYAVQDGFLYVNLYIGNQATIELDGTKLEIRQKTDYPWDGKVEIELNPADAKEFTLMLRIPGWLTRPMPGDLYSYADPSGGTYSIRVNGDEVHAQEINGYATIQREWKAGDRVSVEMDMKPRRIVANTQVTDLQGMSCIAVGPVVYAAEWVDNGGRLFNVFVPEEAETELAYHPELLDGVNILKIKAKAVSDKQIEEKWLHMIPYYGWSHRGVGEMRVWFPLTADGIEEYPPENYNSQCRAEASHSYSEEYGPMNLNDRIRPGHSADMSIGFQFFWPHKGTEEWARYSFPAQREVDSVAIYWLDDSHEEGTYARLPADWTLYYKKGAQWLPVQNIVDYPAKANEMNRLSFKAVKTGGLMIKMKLQEGYSGGMYEWEVYP